ITFMAHGPKSVVSPFWSATGGIEPLSPLGPFGDATMDFPLSDLLDEQACYDFLVDALHPDGLACPACGGSCLTIHRAHRAPVLHYRCACGRVFNAWTGTALQGTQRRPSALGLIARGIAQGTPTARLARELGCSRYHLLELRHRLQHLAWIRLPRQPSPHPA